MIGTPNTIKSLNNRKHSDITSTGWMPHSKPMPTTYGRICNYSRCLIYGSTRSNERGFNILEQGSRCNKATPTPHSAGRKAYQLERSVQKRRLHRTALPTDLGAATTTLVSAETPIQDLPCMQVSQLRVEAFSRRSCSKNRAAGLGEPPHPVGSPACMAGFGLASPPTRGWR